MRPGEVAGAEGGHGGYACGGLEAVGVGGAGEDNRIQALSQHMGGGVLDSADHRVVEGNLGGFDATDDLQLRLKPWIVGPRVIQEPLQVGRDALGGHPRHQTDVASEPRVSRVHAVVDPCLRQDTHIHGGTEAPQMVGLVGEIVLHLGVHPLDEPSHLNRGIDRVEPVGDAGVHLGALHMDVEEQPAPGDHPDVLPLGQHPAGLADDGRVPVQVAFRRHPLGTQGRACFLVGGEHQLELARPSLDAGQRRRRVHHGGHRHLHVPRAQSVKVAVPYHRIPGVGLPAGHVPGGLGVEVARQDEVATLSGAGNPHHQIGAFGHGRQLGYVGHTQLLQTLSN
ncbi:MAG: hypothetical protein OXN80_00845 [bacterium]|nr:hypothetical protein [bacterium]